MLKITCYTILLFLISSCKSGDNNIEAEPIAPGTPVAITTISSTAMEDLVELPATSSFQQKWIVRANTTGYLQSATPELNRYVNFGQVLFTVKTKEAQSIGNSINILDSSFRFTGINRIKANGSGFISQVNHQSGDYVQDGDQLAVITDTRSFVFLLNLPYELRPYIINKKSLEIVLPDGEKLTGMVSGILPAMDATTQTQGIILKVNPGHPIPENLIARVTVVKSFKENPISLPRLAVLADESQTGFWVMKLINDSIAVKTPVKKGIESAGRIEILSPLFNTSDRIVVTGNYGLDDTAKVQIVKE